MLDPLDALGEIDFTSQDASAPLLPSGMHRLRIASIDTVDSKTTTGNKNALVEFQTVDEVQAHDSTKMVPAGWKLSSYYPLQHNAEALEAIARGDKPKWNFLDNFTRLMDAVLGTTKETRPSKIDLPSYVGEEVMAMVQVEEMKDSAGNGTGIMTNRVGKLSHPV